MGGQRRDLFPCEFIIIIYLHITQISCIQDRFATSRIPPAVDEQQDWILVGGEEESGFTILEFTRSYITCDENDLPISVRKLSVCIILVYANFCGIYTG